MNGKHFSAGVALFLGLVGGCFAQTQSAQGVVQISGSVVEAPCTATTGVEVAGQATSLKLDGCPELARGELISVRRIDPVYAASIIGQSGVKVKLIYDSGKGERYYAQRYSLVDGSGHPVVSGSYLITLVTP